MTEEEIINGLIAGGINHDRALSTLYNKKEYKSSIVNYLRFKGLSDDDSNMLWTDIVIKFSNLVMNGKYEHQNNMMGYIKNLSGYVLLNFLRDNKRTPSFEINESTLGGDGFEDVKFFNKELSELLDAQLETIGKVCHDVLKLWSRDYSMQEISDRMNFVSLEATRKRKHICLKKLLESIENNPSVISLLKDYYYNQ